MRRTVCFIDMMYIPTTKHPQSYPYTSPKHPRSIECFPSPQPTHHQPLMAPPSRPKPPSAVPRHRLQNHREPSNAKEHRSKASPQPRGLASATETSFSGIRHHACTVLLGSSRTIRLSCTESSFQKPSGLSKVWTRVFDCMQARI